MKKSWMLFLFGSLLAAEGLVLSARVQNDVYAMEFKSADNHLAAINLMNGALTGTVLVGAAPTQRP
jgi:hypothetical protein